MPALQLTCPVELRCSIWIDIDGATDAVTAALAALDGTHEEQRDLRVITLPDPTATLDAARNVLAACDARLRLLVASRRGVAEPPWDAWAWLDAHCGGPVIDGENGAAGALAHYGPARKVTLPPALADEQLPAGTGLLLWVSAEEERLLWVTQDRLTIGRIAENDLVIPHVPMSRRHAIIEREHARWTARDYESAGGFGVNGLSSRQERHELAPGTVIQFAIPYRIVVLAVRG